MMSNEMSIASSLAGASRLLTATTIGLAAAMGTSYLAGSGDELAAKGPAVVVGAQHVPTDKLQEMHHVQRMRAPLHDFFGIELETEEPAPNAPDAKESASPADVWKVNEHLIENLEDYDLEFLVMTVADPIDAVNNSFFDHQLDALQKALVADPDDSWLYSGGYLPWQAFKDHRSIVKEAPLFRKKHWYMDEPGLLLFRKEKATNSRTRTFGTFGKKAKDALLLVYLVGEVPTLGVQRDALTHAIHDILVLSKVKRSQDDDESYSLPLSIRIVGPTFTGGAHSLKEGLRLAGPTIKNVTKGLTTTKTKSPSVNVNAEMQADTKVPSINLSIKLHAEVTDSRVEFDGPADALTPSTTLETSTRITKVVSVDRDKDILVDQVLFKALIINGSATAIPDEYFAEDKTEDQLIIRYLARTVCRDEETFNALHAVAGASPIIWLTETGTAFSDQVRTKKQLKQTFIDDIFIPVPVGISRVRGAFERQLTAAKQQMVGLPLIASTSPLPFDPEETSHDTPAIQTPQITAPAAELLLHQIMRTIASKNSAYVGIMATDVRDSIFLAEMLKLHCPHVQLLIAESDILLIHTNYTDSICGSIVASSYPLFPEGMEACRRDDRSLPIMGGPAQYGIYNAILLQRLLSRTGQDLSGDVSSDYLSGLLKTADTTGPRVWLHRVGYDRFYPMNVTEPQVKKADGNFATNISKQHPTHSLKVAGKTGPIFHFNVNPAWYSFAIVVALIWLAIVLSWRGNNVSGDLFEPLHVYSIFGRIYRNVFRLLALALFGITTGSLLFFLITVRFRRTAGNLAWLTESYFFSGVTLLLPLFCGCAAGIAMCYMKMRQSFLVSDQRTMNAGAIQGQLRTYESLWIGCGGNTPQLKSVASWLVVCVCGPIWCLGWIWHFTRNTSDKPVLFWLTWIIIAAGFVMWWLASFELFIFQRQLRDRAKEFARGLTGTQRTILESLHDNGLRGVYRVLFGPSPGSRDAVAKYASPNETVWSIPTVSAFGTEDVTSADVARTLYAFREIQYRLVIIKNQFYLLLLGALFLFAAVVAYPFTSGMMMRSLATLTILALAGGVCLCFWKLERDEALSEILGTKPNEIEMNISNMSFFASYGLIAILVLLSQFVPGSWMALGRLIGPLLHVGH